MTLEIFRHTLGPWTTWHAIAGVREYEICDCGFSIASAGQSGRAGLACDRLRARTRRPGPAARLRQAAGTAATKAGRPPPKGSIPQRPGRHSAALRHTSLCRGAVQLTRLRPAGPRLAGPRLTAPGLAGPRLTAPGLVGLRLTAPGLVALRLTGPRLTGGQLGRSHGQPGGLGRPGRTSRPARNRLAQLRPAGPYLTRLRPAASDLTRLRQARLRETGLQAIGLREGRPPGRASPLPAALLPPCHAGKSAAVMLGRVLLPRRAQVIRV